MTAEPDSEIAPKAAASVQDVLHGSIVGIPPAIQDIAAGDALRHANELGNPSSAEITEILVIVTANVLETQITPDAVLDARAQSPLGRRLLQAMKQEVMRSWRMYGITETQLPSLLLALERVREGMENDPARAFASQLGGEGIKLLVEVAHDMHSPLASVLFLAETLQRGESGPVNELQRRQLGLICTAAFALSSVGKDIIDLERSDLLLEPKPVPFSVTSVLEAVRDIVRPIAEVKQLTVRVEPPQVDERLGHPVALRRVLLNLTTNALKFTERGFVEITAHEERPGWVEFGVRDSGRGIDPAVMPTLFDPVRRAPAGERDACGRKLFSNTGLGLTICRKLAEAMGSVLRVETHLGRGTRFFFELELPICQTRRNSGPERKRQATTAA
ncbi:MAG TPA: HAMP domain-containing sensor histidine kinase [Gemmatimonadales bacterium]|nr:HAMP domain-containing sensor histidine kinase [Gemmatimonadales bacterium]